MIIYIIRSFFLIIQLLVGSQLMTPQSKTGDLPVIDISKKYSKKHLTLQDVADVEYVRLETTDEVLMCGVSLSDVSVLASVTDKYIITYELKRGDIFVFNRNGKIVDHFNRKGGGSQEYAYISGHSGGVIFDEKNEEIFVCSHNQNKIQVYSLSGKYKRTLNFDGTGYSEICNFNDETLLVYDEINYIDTFKTKKNQQPYRLISKQNGSTVDVLDINLPQRYSSTFNGNIIRDGKSIPMKRIIDLQNNRYNGQDFMIADLSSDTMYALTRNKELSSLLVRKPSVHASEPLTVWSIVFTTDKYMMIRTVTLDWAKAGIPLAMSKSIKIFVYEFQSGEIYDLLFVNTSCPSIAWMGPQQPVSTAKNTTAELIPVHTLKEYARLNFFKGDFEKFVEQLDDEDNPIVRIVKFK